MNNTQDTVMALIAEHEENMANTKAQRLENAKRNVMCCDKEFDAMASRLSQAKKSRPVAAWEIDRLMAADTKRIQARLDLKAIMEE